MNFIKRWVRALLAWAKDETTDSDDLKLEVVLGGKVYKATAQHVYGIMLMCEIDMGAGVCRRLITSQQARDKPRFKDLWGRLGGKQGRGVPMTWEDGTPVDLVP